MHRPLQEFILTQKVFRKMISLIQNQEWKDVRTSITPAFTTGKIKRVCSFKVSVAKIFKKLITREFADVLNDKRVCRSSGCKISKNC